MSASDLNVFCQNLVRSKLLTEAEVTELRKQARAETGAAALPEGFAGWLVRKGKLTRFQADSVLRGHVRLILDDYTLLDRIGAGRMAGVYRAEHRMGMPVAVKILPPSKAKQEECLARFQREAHLAMQLDDPHVVRTFHAGCCEGLHYIAMEYLEGESLEERLEDRGRQPPIEAVRIIHQAMQGLQHLHEKGVVHRDLKPGNLMLVALPKTPGDEGPTFTVKLLDIGLGRALFDEGGIPNADLTTDGALLGTPDYMAPEQSRSSHAADVRSDLYSLGCVLYQCLTGRVPFPDRNVVQKLIRHTREMPPPPELGAYPLAAALKGVLWKLLAKDPAMRYPTPRDAARALEPFLAIQVAAPVRPPPPMRPPVPVAPPLAEPVKPSAIDVEPVAEAAAADNFRQVLYGVGALLIVAIGLLIVLLLSRGT